MHPLLFRIPLPALRLPLGAALAALGLFGAVVAVFGWRRRSRDLASFGVVLAGCGLVAAFFGRGRVVELGALPVPAFGALLALALGAGSALTLRLAARDGIERDAAGHACAAAFVLGLVGARLGYVLLHAGELQGPSSVFAFREGGLSGPFAVAGGVGGAWLSLRRRGVSPLAWLDAAAPAFVFGAAVVRIGCWLEGCDYGKRLNADAPAWLERLGTFDAASRAWTEQVLAQTLSPAALRALPVHPASLYEACGAFGIGIAVLVLRARKPARGVTALVALFGYAFVRVLVDWLRTPSADVWAARGMLLAGMAVAALAWGRRPRAPAAPHGGPN